MALNNLWKYLNLLIKNTFYTSLKYCNKPFQYHRQNNEWKTKQKVAEFKEEHKTITSSMSKYENESFLASGLSYSQRERERMSTFFETQKQHNYDRNPLLKK